MFCKRFFILFLTFIRFNYLFTVRIHQIIDRSLLSSTVAVLGVTIWTVAWRPAVCFVNVYNSGYIKLVARRSLPTAIENEKNWPLLRMVELIAHLNLHRGGASLMVCVYRFFSVYCKIWGKGNGPVCRFRAFLAFDEVLFGTLCFSFVLLLVFVRLILLH